MERWVHAETGKGRLAQRLQRTPQVQPDCAVCILQDVQQEWYTLLLQHFQNENRGKYDV